MSDTPKELIDVIRQEFEEYRAERTAIGGSSLSDRDVTNMVMRLEEAVSDFYEEMDQQYVDQLEAEISELEVKANDGRLQQEYENVKSIAKQLLYIFTEEDEQGRHEVVLQEDNVKDMFENISMYFERKDGKIIVETREVAS
jgi:Na+/phosphate symporter